MISVTVILPIPRHSAVPTCEWSFVKNKELNMVQNGQPEQPAFLELSLEEMEDIIGGMTLNEWIWGEIILIKATLATGGLHIYTGPLK